MDDGIREKIHDANIAVHRFEAQYYELLHPEVYGREEQQRIAFFLLKTVDNLIVDNRRRALDLGAGTGNLTGKLLQMGYEVIAVDISSEMRAILRKRYRAHLEAKKLVVVTSAIEDAFFEEGEFDLVACYSVLHHLPDYTEVLQRLSTFLRKGGVMYIDHEASPFYWQNEDRLLASLVKYLYFHSNPLINFFYFKLIGLTAPSLDYTFSDYWHKKEHPLSHDVIEQVFNSKRFTFYKRIDYHLTGTWVSNPVYFFYRHLCKPEMSCWIAKK